MNGESDSIERILSIADATQKRAALAAHINNLILSDFNGLVQILYRMDINEFKLRELLSEKRDTDAGELIAGLMIARQIQKQESRELFSRRDPDISDEEKW